MNKNELNTYPSEHLAPELTLSGYPALSDGIAPWWIAETAKVAADLYEGDRTFLGTDPCADPSSGDSSPSAFAWYEACLSDAMTMQGTGELTSSERDSLRSTVSTNASALLTERRERREDKERVRALVEDPLPGAYPEEDEGPFVLVYEGDRPRARKVLRRALKILRAYEVDPSGGGAMVVRQVKVSLALDRLAERVLVRGGDRFAVKTVGELHAVLNAAGLVGKP